MKKLTLLFVLIISGSALLFSLSGCVHNVSPNTYTHGEVGVASRVDKGVIISKRVIKIEKTSGVGGLAGAAGGAAAGSAIGGSAPGNIVGAVGGAVAVGVIGHEIDKSINRRTGYEYIIKLDEGRTISITQEKSVQLIVGQRVLVIYGAMTRVVPDDTRGR